MPTWPKEFLKNGASEGINEKETLITYKDMFKKHRQRRLHPKNHKNTIFVIILLHFHLGK